jgi:CMP-N-acetylneuraminic acid synthetase
MAQTMNTLAVILARAGSEGLPGKHLLHLLGRPVISYTFEHARCATTLSRIVVSSDCSEVRRLAAGERLESIARPAHLASSGASVQDVMLHALETVESRSPFRADALVVLYGNVPVRAAGVIDRAVRMLQETGCDSVRSFSPVGKWHPAWMAELHGDCVKPLHAGSIHRRQDLAPMFLHDGAVVAVKRGAMLKGLETPDDPHAFFGADRRGFAGEIGDTVEVDEPRDLYWAEAVLRDARHDRNGIRMAS